MKIYIWEKDILKQWGDGVIICAANNLEEATEKAIKKVHDDHPRRLEAFFKKGDEFDTIAAIITNEPKIVEIEDFIFSIEGSA